MLHFACGAFQGWPEFVKIDKHFVNGIADDRIKFHFVRAMQDLAEIGNASLVAEGIERDGELVPALDDPRQVRRFGALQRAVVVGRGREGRAGLRR